MKLFRFGPVGAERAGLVDREGRMRDLSSVLGDIDGAALSAGSLRHIANIDVATLPLVQGSPRIGVPVANISKVVAIGLNYADHAQEANLPVPQEPVMFMKATTSLCGPNDDTVVPRGSLKLDWEVELGIVIGRKAQYVSEGSALQYVAGYCVANDVSERHFQLERGGQWDKGKGCDSFGPLGPYLVTSDEVGDPQNLSLWLDVNGKRMQSGTTANMIFSCAHIVSYVSQFMTLLPGDVIITGTPAGVGIGQKPPVYLKAGDVVTLGIQGLGEQCQVVREGQLPQSSGAVQ